MTQNTCKNIKAIQTNDPYMVKKIIIQKNVLGIVEFNPICEINFIPKQIPYIHIPLKPLKSSRYFEIWTTASKHIHYGKITNLPYACDNCNLFAAVSCEVENLKTAAEKSYNQLLYLLNQSKYNRPYRIWNFIPNLHRNNASINKNYQNFCAGRSIAFKKHTKKFEFPAATGIITKNNENLGIFLLATNKLPCVNLENLNQISAYNYPKQYGNLSPSFSRATYVKKDNGKCNIFISGTASIVGHKSLHKDDPLKQLATTLKNIQLLLSKKNLRGHNINNNVIWRNLEAIKIYIKHESDLSKLKEKCDRIFSNQQSIIYLEADICRPELLVEIEGMV